MEITPEPWQLLLLTTTALSIRMTTYFSNWHQFFACAGAATAVGDVSQCIQSNARRHDNHLQLCRVQRMMRGQKTKVLAEGRHPSPHFPIFCWEERSSFCDKRNPLVLFSVNLSELWELLLGDHQIRLLGSMLVTVVNGDIISPFRKRVLDQTSERVISKHTSESTKDWLRPGPGQSWSASPLDPNIQIFNGVSWFFLWL